ncbi:AzlC family ABC transporter permease [Psychrobacter sp. HD31]|uniref:AzlC family ABC transporter permease n=1 Tax=Psychrobacter sp. HD31 TaxID=3112003 RepID=UPI003DA6747F
MQKSEIHQTDWKKGFSYSLPVAMGYLPAGIAFGVLAQVAGIPLWASIMLSVVLFAGAAQYACIPMLASGIPLSQLGTNIAAINLRHVFYGLPLLQQLPTNILARTYCLFALTDETFSVLTSLPKNERQAVMLPVSLFNQSWWVLATIIGGLLGNILGDMIPHLDFALICLFVILAYEQFKAVNSFFPIFVAFASIIVALPFASDWLLLTSIGLSTIIILVVAKFKGASDE